MRALLLAAGFGTRLRPLTNSSPKCLIPVGGKPLLEHWLEALHTAGFDDIMINTHYLSEQVYDFVQNSSFADFCTILHEPQLRGTAGTLMANIDIFRGDDLFMAHADNYITAAIPRFLAAFEHRHCSAIMSMMTFFTKEPKSAGIVEIDSQCIVKAFQEKPDRPTGNLANAAVYLLSAEMLEILKQHYPDVTDFSTEILPNFIGKIEAHAADGIVVDIGTPARYQALCDSFGKPPHSENLKKEVLE